MLSTELITTSFFTHFHRAYLAGILALIRRELSCDKKLIISSLPLNNSASSQPIIVAANTQSFCIGATMDLAQRQRLARQDETTTRDVPPASVRWSAWLGLRVVQLDQGRLALCVS